MKFLRAGIPESVSPSRNQNAEDGKLLMTLPRQKLDRFALRAVCLIAVLIPVLIPVVGLSLASTAAAQNLVRFNPTQRTTNASAPDVALELEIDFFDVTVGGGVEVTYDSSLLEFVAFTFSQDPNFGLLGPADGDPTQPLEIGAGWFMVEPPFGVSGVHTIGTFVFRLIGNGVASVSANGSPISPGPYFSPSSSTPLVVSYNSATVNIGPVAVPTLGVFGRLTCCAVLFLIAIRTVIHRDILGGARSELWE